jgi:hypothetical protein
VAAIDLGKLRELAADRLRQAVKAHDSYAAEQAAALLEQIDARDDTLARRMAIAAKGATPGTTVKNPHPPPAHVKRLLVGEGRREA